MAAAAVVPASADCVHTGVLLGAGPPIEATKNIDLIRFANMRDITKMMKIYKSYSSRWRLYREYTRREFEHNFLRRGDVATYVIRTERGDVKDFVSITTLTLPRPPPHTPSKVAVIHFVSYLNEKLLELFLQNVLYILAHNGYESAYIEDVNGVGDVCRTKLGFEETHSKWYYQFNYNTQIISKAQTQFSSVMI